MGWIEEPTSINTIKWWLNEDDSRYRIHESLGQTNTRRAEVTEIALHVKQYSAFFDGGCLMGGLPTFYDAEKRVYDHMQESQCSTPPPSA